MKKKKASTSFFAIIILLFLSSAVWGGGAMNFGPSVEVPSGEIIKGDYFCAGASVVIDGTITGDLKAYGASVVITGDVGGDVEVGAGSIVVMGTIGGDLDLGGGAILIDSNVEGDLSASAGSIKCAGNIAGDATMGAGKIELSATVGGDAHCAGEVNIISAAEIMGNLYYYPEDRLTVEEGALIHGDTILEVPEEEKFNIVGFITQKVWFWAALFLIGLALFLYKGKTYRQTVAGIAEAPLKALLFGLLFFIVLPLAGVILIITIVGIPLGIILLLTFIILLPVSLVLTSTFVGERILMLITKKKALETKLLLSLLVGSFIFVLLSCIPFIAWLFYLAVFLFGIGAVWNMYLKERKESGG